MQKTTQPTHSYSLPKALVATHVQADPDAVASALAIFELLRSQGYSVELYFPGGPNLQAKRLLKEFFPGLSFHKDLESLASDQRFAKLVIVDTSNPSQVPGFWELVNRVESVEIYDHHRLTEQIRQALEKLPKSKLSLHIFASPSLSEEMYRLLRVQGIRVTPELASMLLAGILTDTKFLRLAREETLKVVKELESLSSLSVQQLRAILLEGIRDISRRIAFIKALKRARFFQLDRDFIFAITHSSSFESDVANLMIQCCADLAIVIAYKKKEKLIRIALRSHPQNAKKVSAFGVARAIAESLGGSWGGHEHACIVSLKLQEAQGKRKVVEKYLNKVLKIVTNALGANSGAYKEITV